MGYTPTVAQTTAPTLNAAPDLIIIDLEADETEASTEVEYSKEIDHGIWHRWKPGAWLRVTLQVTAPDDPALAHGYFTSPKLRPGWVYQVSVWEAGVDPNRLPNVDIPPEPLARLNVFALRKRPEARGFFSDENQRVGGTYREHDLATTVPVLAYMAVSTDPPRNNDGYLLFDRIDGSTVASLNQSFQLRITDLLPGTHYHELVRFSDEFGNWEFLTREFTTLQRRIKVEPTDLFISDDSDELSNGEGSFELSLYTGGNLRQQLSYSNGNLESGKSVAPPPAGVIIVGPEAVTPTTRTVTLRASGRENDAGSVPLDDDDLAWGSKDLLVPVGPDERVTQRADSILADTSDDLKFTFSFKYSVEYF